MNKVRCGIVVVAIAVAVATAGCGATGGSPEASGATADGRKDGTTVLPTIPEMTREGGMPSPSSPEECPLCA